jgi:DNA end-binding protein Ku
MFSGVHVHEGLDLDMLHKEDHAPIRYARICKKDGKEIDWDDIVKGFQYREGEYVVLTDADFDKANPKKTQTIDIHQFVVNDEIDIRYFDKPYYLEPVKGGEKAYALLRAALEKSDKLALARFVMHQKEHMGVIKPVGRALVLNQMRFPTDIRQPANLTFPTDAELTDKEVEVAIKLIQQETKHFIPEDFHDTYTEELEEIIKAKTKGVKPKARSKAPEDTPAGDLMSALKASLNQS